ncbi:MAG: OadG family transporter subunit [Desulfuromonas sp.]|nr:OadG family transporter subunit [Desulfuromonas sp.]
MVQFDNIIAENGIGITVTGMTIVFSGLLLINLFIILLPRILKTFDRVRSKPEQTLADTSAPHTLEEPTEGEIMSAIALVIHIELERCGGDLQQITIKKHPAAGSFWTTAGKMRSLSNRSPYA